NSDGGFFAVEDAAQIADVFHAGFPAFDLEDDLFRLRCFRVVAEKNFAVNAVIRAFLLLDRASGNEAERPPLKLIFVLLGQDGGIRRSNRLANSLYFDASAVSFAQAMLDERGGK